MAAAQVVQFRSGSTSPVAPSVSLTKSPRHLPNKNSMASSGPSTTQANNSPSITNNGSTMATNYEGITALMLACQQGRAEDVQKLLRKKSVSIKERTRSGKVALHFCAESGSASCFDFVLAAEPFLINAQDEEGYTPLHLAVINGSKDIVRKLIAAGADINCLDNERHSLVHWATVCGEVEILDNLLSSGAPASTPDIHLAHPIHYAAQMCGSVNGVGSVSRARVQSTVYGVSPKKGLQILKRLIQFGVPIDVRDQDGRQPLLWAASAGGVHMHRRKFEQHQRVHRAYSFVGSGDAILFLINAGAKVDAEDKDGLTALHCAASRGHTDCLETLIALCGAEVDVIDNNGCTALFYAVTLGHADCTELLLNYGAEPNRQDRKGRTPAHCGAAKGQLETLKILSKHGGSLWQRNVRGDLPLHEAVLSRRKDLVVWLLSQRHDAINSPNNDGRCPIHLAALNNNVEMVKILIDYQADINLLMRSGKGTAMTPLDAAIHKGNSAVAKFIQLHGGLPSNSLNDAALQRRINRSIEGQISPAGSMRGSQMGSHHHPSPEDHQMRTFTSPDVFDNSLVNFSRNTFHSEKRGEAGPFLATSTPIMDDGVQTDIQYVRDMEVQVSSDSLEQLDESTRGSKQQDESTSTSHRKAERRRQVRRSREQSEGSSSESASSSERSSKNRDASGTSKKSSRRKSSGASSHARNSVEKQVKKVESEETEVTSTSKNTSFETDEKEVGKKAGVTPQGSSDTMLDNTLMSEKFSELENVGLQSSETDARDEELSQNTKDHNKSGSSDSESKQEDTEIEKEVSKTEKRRSKSRDGESPEKKSVKSRSPSRSKSRSKERSLSAKSPNELVESSESRGVSAQSIRSASAKETRGRESKSRSVSGRKGRPSSMKDSNLIVRPPTGKRSSVTWHDETDGKGSKDEEDTSRERRSKSKSVEAKSRSQSRDGSKSPEKRERRSKSKSREKSSRDSSTSPEKKERRSKSKSREREDHSKSPSPEVKERRSKSKSIDSSSKSRSSEESPERKERRSKSKSKEPGTPKDDEKRERKSKSREPSDDKGSHSDSPDKKERRSKSKSKEPSDKKERRSKSKSKEPTSNEDSGKAETPETKRRRSKSKSKEVASPDSSQSSDKKERRSKSKSVDASPDKKERRSKSKSVDTSQDGSSSPDKKGRRSKSKSIDTSRGGSTSPDKKDRRSKSKSIDASQDDSQSAEKQEKRSKSKSKESSRDRSESPDKKERRSKSKSQDRSRASTVSRKGSKSPEDKTRRSKSKSLSQSSSGVSKEESSPVKNVSTPSSSPDRSKSQEKNERRSKSKDKSRDGSQSPEKKESRTKSKSRESSQDGSKSPEKSDRSTSKSKSPDRSESPEERSKSKSPQRSLSREQPSRNESVEKIDTPKVSGTPRKSSEEKDDSPQSKSGRSSRLSQRKSSDKTQNDEEEDEQILNEIEAGRTINLQEAARKRSESIARNPSLSRSRSVSQSVDESSLKGSAAKPLSRKNNKTNSKLKLGKRTSSKRIPPTTSEEREIQLQEALLASSKKLRPKGSNTIKSSKIRKPVVESRYAAYNRKSSDERQYIVGHHTAALDSGISEPRGLTTDASEDYIIGKSNPNMLKRKFIVRRPGSGSKLNRKSIFSSTPKQYRVPNADRSDLDALIYRQLTLEQGLLHGTGGGGDDTNSTSTRGGSVTSDENQELSSRSPRRRRANLSRPRSKLTFSRGEDRASPNPKPKIQTDVDTPISVTQAMQASMRKYNLERAIFQELLELKRLQIRAGKANEQLLVKRIAENYRKAGYSVNFRDYDGPYNFRNFEKYLYDQLRLLQSNKRLLPRFAPSDDIDKLSTALKKMNSTKLPFLEEAERNESSCDNIQCTHTTHRCHHAAHAYTGVPCAAYIGSRKNGFLPKVNPLRAPGPTQKDSLTRTALSRNGTDPMNLSSPMQISISPRTDTQSPITLEVQQGANTQVFTLPTKALDPHKNYYVSLSIKPNPLSEDGPSPPSHNDSIAHRPSPGDVVEDGSISAPPPPAENDADVHVDVDRDKHNRSM